MHRLVLLLACVWPAARCYSSGLVTGACADLRPRHAGVPPRANPAPFSVTAGGTSYGESGGKITVRLQAPGSTPFKGFMLQAREVDGEIPLGSFAVTGGAAQLLTCNGAPNSAVSHTSDSPKTLIEATWTAATSEDPKPVEFRASFVQDFRTFWVQVRSPQLTYSGGFLNSSTGPPANLTSPFPSVSLIDVPTISRAGCGVTKTCFSQPPNCDPAGSATCYHVSASVAPRGGSGIQFAMTGPSPGYISFGFSDDKEMGNDDIYICALDGNGLVQLQHAFSTGARAPRALPLGNVSDVSGSMRDGVIGCSFTSMNVISTQRTTGVDQPYHLLFAYGPTSNGQIRFHTGTFASASKVFITRPQLLSKSGQPPNVKAHGALMLIAWMTTGALGMIVARYLKGVAKSRSYWGKAVWFLAHVALMSLTTATTIIAFIIIFSHVRGWSEGTHPVLGCLVMILSFLQPVGALFRCGPHHHLRFLFNWSHALNAVAIKGLAVAAVFSGLRLIDSTEDRWLMKVMGGFVGWEALFYVLFEFHDRRKNKDAEDAACETESFHAMLLAAFLLGNLAFLVALLVGIAMS